MEVKKNLYRLYVYNAMGWDTGWNLYNVYISRPSASAEASKLETEGFRCRIESVPYVDEIKTSAGVLHLDVRMDDGSVEYRF